MASGSTSEKREAQSRWQQALEADSAAHFNFEGGHLETAIDRAYYAVFYAVQACLVLIGKHPKSHQGSVNLFSQHFVKTGEVEPDYVAVFQKLMENRIQADYAARNDFTSEEVTEILQESRKVLRRIHEYLKTKLKNIPPPE